MTSSHAPYFVYPRRVAYHETDAMGVVHHANHVKYFEEARVEWLRNRGFMDHHQPYGPYVFAVTHQEAKYFRTAGFDEPLEVWLQSKMEGAKIYFQYALFSHKSSRVIAAGQTTLVPIDSTLKPVRLPKDLLDAYRREPWDSTWPPQSKSQSK